MNRADRQNNAGHGGDDAGGALVAWMLIGILVYVVIRLYGPGLANALRAYLS